MIKRGTRDAAHVAIAKIVTEMQYKTIKLS